MLILRKSQAGFSLLEILVVLMIFSLISVMLMQGLAYTLDMRGRLLFHLQRLQHSAMQQAWFISTVEGIVADYEDLPPDQIRRFEGKPLEFHALASSTLHAAPGVPAEFGWKLENDGGNVILQYLPGAKKEDAWEVAHWQGSEAGFRYLAPNGIWYDRWPPQETEWFMPPDWVSPTWAQGRSMYLRPKPQIPRAIMLQAQAQGRPLLWLARLVDLDLPRVDFRVVDME
jgi:prepilin-type N-terminal cleavage/methylation domain-containing protein